MRFLGITQKTINWFLSHTEYLYELEMELPKLILLETISDGVISVGPLRITSENKTVICIWNNEYITGTDYEDWGFIKLNGPLGVFERKNIFEEVFERELFVINQRLQGRLLPEIAVHRGGENNSHSCIAGRGETARQFNVGWFEDKVKLQKASLNSIVCLGPFNVEENSIFEKIIIEAAQELPKLIESSNNLLVKVKNRPVLETSLFKSLKDRFSIDILKKGHGELPVESVPELEVEQFVDEIKYSTITNTYDDWIKEGSSLSKVQREILESDVLLKQPIRIIGSAGTGKSLLMQLLAMRRLVEAEKQKVPVSIIYIVHNFEMVANVTSRFEVLDAHRFLQGNIDQKINITTLYEHALAELNLEGSAIIDKDAQQTKLYQRYAIQECIEEVFKGCQGDIAQSDLLTKIQENDEYIEAFADLVVTEIGVAIKGRGLTTEKKQYVEAERPLSRFHGVLSAIERKIIFNIFEKYREKFEADGVLDSDDIAISLLGHLRTPLWELKRKKLGFDFVFVDETQLFNQNERLLFRFLPKNTVSGHMPIALALDEAQEIKGASSAGFGLLGIEGIVNETLPSVYRCTPAILNLAFFTISRTTDLFGNDFPDFTTNTTTVIPQSHPLAKPPYLISKSETQSFGKAIVKEVRSLRKNNLRQIAVIVHSERYWKEVLDSLKKEDLPVIEAVKRGELIDPKKPIVYVARPEHIGGQEFDAVVCVGLEYGVVPPIFRHAGVSEALEQQSLREIYLAFTRAKYQLVIVNSNNSTPSPIIQQAINNGFIKI
jgi:hypothetical protein